MSPRTKKKLDQQQQRGNGKAAASSSSSGALPGSRQAGVVAAADFKWAGGQGGIVRPIWQALQGRGARTMIDFQKGRNNYYNLDVRDQSAMCRRMADRNWFLRPVVALRHASWCESFDVRDDKGESMSSQYAFAPLVSDIMHERLISSNVVCLWRKGEKLPTVSVLDAEQVEYRSSGGMERIKIQYSQDPDLAKDKQNEPALRKMLGDRMYDAMAKGKVLEIVKGVDEEWDFEVMINGKRRGVFCIPEMVPILDCVDYVELLGIGDWNLAWARKDVIRTIRKGYSVTHGQGAGINSVDITDPDIKNLGEGFSQVNGNCTIPMNHDVNPGYMLVDASVFDPKIVETAFDKLLTFGGIESVVLFGSFSQQNGAAPSLMRNARTVAFKVRQDVQDLMNRILSAKEFSSLEWGGGETDKNVTPVRNYSWGVKSLYSMDELLQLVKGTDNGISSRTTAREMLGLNDKIEGDRLEQEHENRERYAPAFESGQALLAAMFPDLAAAAGKSTPTNTGEPGRPVETPAET